MKIRPIELPDYESWLDLRQRLWPDHNPQDLEKEGVEILKGPEKNAVLGAFQPGGKMIGFIEVSLRDWAEGCSTRPVGYIEGWFVLPEGRRSGVGRRLVEAAEDWACQKGCQEMASDAEQGNETSRLAHLALGYDEAIRLICFSKKLT